jgi:iron complex transport system permease protein
VLIVIADTVARTAFDPQELPVGVLTAVIGGPVFILLVRARV